MPPSRRPTFHPPESGVAARLRELSDDPAAQSAYALAMLAKRPGKESLMPVLAVLADLPQPEARPHLLALFEKASGNPAKFDQGAYLRRALLDALRPLVRMEDIPLLCQAAETYERWPPDFIEEGALLRVAALVALARVDEELTRFYAARLLVDPETDRMSGEPALSAARILGAQGDEAPLYLYVWQAEGRFLPEVAGEALRQMVRLPLPLLPALVERFGHSPHVVTLVGLYDLLLTHAEGVQQQPYLEAQWRTVKELAAYRYLIFSTVATGHEPLLDALAAYAPTEPLRRRVEILVEAFDLLAGHSAYAKAGERLRRKMGG
jgi:hypothetical protein